MTWRQLFSILAVSVLLGSCASTSPFDFSSLATSSATNPPAQQSTETEAICKWGKAAGLPHRNPVRQEVRASNMRPEAQISYRRFDREVVGTSVAYTCLCGSEERKLELRCDELRS